MASEELVGDVTASDRQAWSVTTKLQCSRIPMRGFLRKARNKTQTLNFKNVDFSLVRELGSKIWWEAVLKGKGAHES